MSFSPKIAFDRKLGKTRNKPGRMNVHHDQGIEYGKIDYKYFPPSVEHNVHLERKEYDHQDII
jgi:hypothetical protein